MDAKLCNLKVAEASRLSIYTQLGAEALGFVLSGLQPVKYLG